MSTKLKIRKGDTVRVISGDAKGQEGKVISVDRETLRVMVEGVNMVSKHTKPTSANPQGGIVKQEASINISNLMLVVNGKTTKVGRKLDPKTNKLVRYAKKSGEVIK
jgi:large subunit ribosomal protein L24